MTIASLIVVIPILIALCTLHLCLGVWIGTHKRRSHARHSSKRLTLNWMSVRRSARS